MWDACFERDRTTATWIVLVVEMNGRIGFNEGAEEDMCKETGNLDENDFVAWVGFLIVDEIFV